MTIFLDWTYKFKFDERFVNIDGIYKVVKIYTYAETISDQVNIYEILYSPLNISEVEFEKDELPIIRINPIYKLIDVKNIENVIYVPEHLIAFSPDPNVKKYHNLTLAWYVGPFQTVEDLSHAQDTVTQLTTKLLGSSTPIKPLDIGSIWLTDSEYQEVQNNREAAKEKYISYFSENIRLRSEIDKLSATINAQAILIKDLVK